MKHEYDSEKLISSNKKLLSWGEFGKAGVQVLGLLYLGDD